MDNLNIDENTINQLKEMLNKGDLSNIVSQIPPEMMQSFSNAASNNSNSQNSKTNDFSNNSGFDFNNIDMNTILKLQSAMNMMNKKDDPRSNLLYSLKPYLRNDKKEKIDKYSNLMNLTKIMDLLKPESETQKSNDILKENDDNA